MAERKPLFMSSSGWSEEMATSDTATFGGLTISSSAGIAMGGFKITNLGDPTSGTDAANKQYVDSVATGLDVKASVRLATAAALAANTAAGSGVGKTLTADANGALSVDGVAVAVGNRILVKDESSGANNGIYTVTATGDGSNPFVLTRATDADQAAEVTAGLFTFVEEGSTNADSGWVLVTNNTITIDTTALTFSKFASVAVYTYDQGLLLTGTSIQVELDTGANAQGAGAGGGSSGLEFDANTASGKLRAAVHATGGLERTATGLAAKLSDTSLTSAAGGLSVAWSPILRAPIAVVEAITAADPVYWSSTADQVGKALANNTAKSDVIGVAKTTQGSAGSSSDIVMHGVCAGILSGATAGTRYYLAAAGGLTTTRPTGTGNRVVSVGFAKNATDLFVQIQDFGRVSQ